MKNPSWIVSPLLFSLAFAVSSCVTVNVNIPEGAVQKETDDYVRELYDAKAKSKVSPSPSPSTTSQSLLEILLPSALATESRPVKANSDKALEIRERLKSRVEEVKTQKAAGLLGESNDGLLVIKGKAKPALMKSLEKMVSDDNADRKELFQEVIHHNNLTQSKLKDIEMSFAHSFQKLSPSNTWIQDDKGDWTQKH